MVSPPTAECTNSSSKYNNKKRKLRLWLVFQRKGGVTNDKVNVNLPALIDTMHMSTSDLTVGALWYKYGSIPDQSQMCHLTFGLRQALALLAGNKKYCFRHSQRRLFIVHDFANPIWRILQMVSKGTLCVSMIVSKDTVSLIICSLDGVLDVIAEIPINWP